MNDLIFVEVVLSTIVLYIAYRGYRSLGDSNDGLENHWFISCINQIIIAILLFQILIALVYIAVK